MTEKKPELTKIEKLKERLKNAQKEEAKIRRAKAKKELEKVESLSTKTKLLIGQFVLEMQKKNGVTLSDFEYESVKFEYWLTDSETRFQLGFKPLEVSK
jgi:hypothetical protein